MSGKTMMNLYFSAAVFLLVTAFSFPCKAQDASGEIINVNPSLQVAFVNLTKSDLSLGDIVSVYQDMTLIGYLKVVGTSDVISKLTVLKDGEGKDLMPADFSKILIGDTVKKEEAPLVRVVNSDAVAAEIKPAAPADKVVPPAVDDQKIELRLESVVAQNTALQEENERLRKDIVMSQEDKMKFFQESVQWHQQLLDMKKRMDYLLQIVDKKIKDD